MPNDHTHLHLALRLSKKIEIVDLDAFFLGNAYPDCWNISIEQALAHHYKRELVSLCDLESFKKNEDINDFNLGYYFDLWIDNHNSLTDTKYQARQNILSSESEAMPLYLVSLDKKKRYEEILDMMVNKFLMDNLLVDRN